MKKLTATTIMAAILLAMASQYSEAEHRVNTISSMHERAAQLDLQARQAAYGHRTGERHARQ